MRKSATAMKHAWRDAGHLGADAMRNVGRKYVLAEATGRIDQRRRDRGNTYQMAAHQVLDALKAIGLDIQLIEDLRRQGHDYDQGVPLLLDWLPRIADAKVKEDVVRTLSVPRAKPDAGPVFIAEFKKATERPGSSTLLSALAEGLPVVGDESLFDDIAAILENRKYGKGRALLAGTVARMDSSR